MDLSVAVMVSVDKREVYDLLLPGISTRVFRGVSLAELLDDVALHLMEHIPKEKPGLMGRYQFCPHVLLRRVKIKAEFPTAVARKTVSWEGRLTVVLTRWPEDDFYVATVPRMGLESFAVGSTAVLEEGLTRFVEAWGARHNVNDLSLYVSRTYEYLEIMEVDAELPTVLPSKVPRPRRQRKKKKRRGKGKGQGEEKRKRRLIPPTALREVGINLNHKAVDGRLGRVFGRERLVEQVFTQLEREGAAVLLVGPHGVGKTAIIHAVVQRLASAHKPLQERTDVWSVDGNRIIAGMSMVGAWERRVERMIAELSARQDILYVDDLPSLVYTGRSAHSDTNVADYLEPSLGRGELRLVGECTPERLEAVREEAPGFFARFHIIQVPELSERETLQVLLGSARRAEGDSDGELVIEPEALEAVLALTRRFMAQRCHPGKAIELLDQLLSDHGGGERDRFGRRVVDRERLVKVFGQQTGLPSFVLWEKQGLRHRQILAHFERRVVAQQAASEAVADVVTVLQQGLNDPQRPLATMLFVGPTGVGKTETAKALAEFLFGSKERLIRFDMSEFREPRAATRLFGDRVQPDGELTRRVSQQPFAVVLFDEIEKAHSAVFDALLQVLGEGRLTNAAGRTTDFCNTVLIMTSNLGVRESQRSMGFGEVSASSRDAHFRKAAEGFFRPEFFNRIDRIIAFRRLDREAMAPLVKRLLQEILGRRGLRRSGVLVQVAPELVELLIEQGFEPRYGARSLRRALEQRLTVPLARHLVSQPADKTTLIDLYRHGEEIGMLLWALDDVVAPSWPRRGDATGGWSALVERFNALGAAWDQLSESEAVREAVETRGELLARFNEDTLAVAQWSQLDATSVLLRMLVELRRGLEEFEERYMRRFSTVEHVKMALGSDLIRNWGKGLFKPVPSVQVYEVDVEAQRGPAWKALGALEVKLAALQWRSEALGGHERPLLVRFDPATDESGGVQWALMLTLAFVSCWSRWADVKVWVRSPQGWCEFDPDQLRESAPEAMPRDGEPGPNYEGASGFALEIRGPGMEAVIGRDVGYHLNTAHVGADMLCQLVRVDEVGQDGVSASRRLSALDHELATWRQAMLSGQRSPYPLEPLPVVRRFKARACLDEETDVSLELGAPPGEAGDALYEVMVRRLLLARLDQARRSEPPQS